MKLKLEGILRCFGEPEGAPARKGKVQIECDETETCTLKAVGCDEDEKFSSKGLKLGSIVRGRDNSNQWKNYITLAKPDTGYHPYSYDDRGNKGREVADITWWDRNKSFYVSLMRKVRAYPRGPKTWQNNTFSLQLDATARTRLRDFVEAVAAKKDGYSYRDSEDRQPPRWDEVDDTLGDE